MNVLPNFEEILNFNKNYSSRLKTWIIAWAWVVWISTVIFYSKQLEKDRDYDLESLKWKNFWWNSERLIRIRK